MWSCGFKSLYQHRPIGLKQEKPMATLGIKFELSPEQHEQFIQFRDRHFTDTECGKLARREMTGAAVEFKFLPCGLWRNGQGSMYLV